MPRTVLFRICCFLVVSALALAPAVSAVPSSDTREESTVHKTLILRDFFVDLWQSATRVLQPRATVLKSITYTYVPYPPYVIAVPGGTGAGTALNPNGVPYTGN